MPEVKQKTLLYKRATFHLGKHSLQSLLTRAVANLSTVGQRRQSFGAAGDSELWAVVGEHSQDDAFFFGVLMRYAPGTAAVSVVDDAEAATLTVERFLAPPIDGKAREWVDGLLFFAVSSNHVVILQSASLRSRGLENHLQWLLHRARVLNGDNTLRLDDRPTLAAADLLKNSDVRDIEIGGDFFADSAHTPAQASVTTSARDRLVEAAVQDKGQANFGPVLDLLRGLLSPEKAAQLNLEALAGTNIGYTLKVRYERKTTEAGQALMNKLGSAFRHAEGVETDIHLTSGATITNDQLRVSGPVRIELFDGVPSSFHVFEVMRTWLLKRLESGEVAA